MSRASRGRAPGCTPGGAPPFVLPLPAAPDPGHVLLGLAAARAEGEEVEPCLVGIDQALTGEHPAPRLFLGLRPEARFQPAPGAADFPWQPGAGEVLAAVARFLAGGPAAGWIGHELGASRLLRHTTYLEIDPLARRAFVVTHLPVGLPGAAARREARFRALAAADVFRKAAGRGGRRPLAGAALAPWAAPRLRVPAAQHAERVRQVLAAIAAGDVYQVNLSHPIEIALDGRDPLAVAATFLALWRANRVPYPALVSYGQSSVLALSPERYLVRRGRQIESRPIKGTRPRHGDPRRDASLARDLAASAKDRAENIMIVDLVRNDLGRVAEVGSVEVAALCEVASFASVHHLVSTVRARLRPETGLADILGALHPAGSMTGAPKIRAVEILRRLEGAPRGAYAGGIGWFAAPDRFHLAMVIRSLLAGPAGAVLPVGGGVVADSDPAGEYQETLDKARSLMAALPGAALAAEGA